MSAIKASVLRYMASKTDILATQEGRRRAVDIALQLTVNTSLEPRQFERVLLEQFVVGDITLDEAINRLESSQELRDF